MDPRGIFIPSANGRFATNRLPSYHQSQGNQPKTEYEPWFLKCITVLRDPTENNIEYLRKRIEDRMKAKYGAHAKPVPTFDSKKSHESKKTKSKSDDHSSSGSSVIVEHKSFASVENTSKVDKFEIQPVQPGDDSQSLKVCLRRTGTVDNDNSTTTLLSNLTDPEAGTDDLLNQFEALDDNKPCSVCQSKDISQNNHLVECMECHSVFHQNCHQPPVTGIDVNDPRLAWYCGKCQKPIPPKLEPSSSSTNTKTASKTFTSTKISPYQSRSTNSSTASSSNNFGRSFGGSSLSSINSDKKFPFRMTSSLQKISPININILSADKRIQNMKKKAAKKKEDKRSSIK